MNATSPQQVDLVPLPPVQEQRPCAPCKGERGWYVRGHWQDCTACAASGVTTLERPASLNPAQQRRVVAAARLGASLLALTTARGGVKLVLVSADTPLSRTGRVSVGCYGTAGAAQERQAAIQALLALNGLSALTVATEVE